jgi:hypothetical protein
MDRTGNGVGTEIGVVLVLGRDMLKVNHGCIAASRLLPECEGGSKTQEDASVAPCIAAEVEVAVADAVERGIGLQRAVQSIAAAE